MSDKTYDRIWELTREAARRAKGLRLAVENIGGGHVSTGAEAALFLKNVKEANVGLTWDPNNAGESGEQSFPDGFRKLDPARIFHVHLRDYKHQDGKVVWTRVGDGEFDNYFHLKALTINGVWGGNPKTYVTLQGSSNWSAFTTPLIGRKMSRSKRFLMSMGASVTGPV